MLDYRDDGLQSLTGINKLICRSQSLPRAIETEAQTVNKTRPLAALYLNKTGGMLHLIVHASAQD